MKDVDFKRDILQNPVRRDILQSVTKRLLNCRLEKYGADRDDIKQSTIAEYLIFLSRDKEPSAVRLFYRVKAFLTNGLNRKDFKTNDQKDFCLNSIPAESKVFDFNDSFYDAAAKIRLMPDCMTKRSLNWADFLPVYFNGDLRQYAFNSNDLDLIEQFVYLTLIPLVKAELSGTQKRKRKVVKDANKTVLHLIDALKTKNKNYCAASKLEANFKRYSLKTQDLYNKALTDLINSGLVEEITIVGEKHNFKAFRNVERVPKESS